MDAHFEDRLADKLVHVSVFTDLLQLLIVSVDRHADDVGLDQGLFGREGAIVSRLLEQTPDLLRSLGTCRHGHFVVHHDQPVHGFTASQALLDHVKSFSTCGSLVTLELVLLEEAFDGQSLENTVFDNQNLIELLTVIVHNLGWLV